MTEEKKVPWDIGLAYQMVRQRHHHYQDLVRKLMRQEEKLLRVAGADVSKDLGKLAKSIEVVEANGGDASGLKAQKAEIERQRADHTPELVDVQLQLIAVREGLKWSDMAFDGLHWLSLSESHNRQRLAEAEARVDARAPQASEA